jgi:Squalene-hopene cyclase N-terminal domain/Prenyltransferase and squalene oxidase repeat
VRSFVLQEFLAAAESPKNGVGMDVIYLTLGLGAAPRPVAADDKILDKFRSYLLDNQRPDGSWKIAKNPMSPTDKIPAPIEDTEDVTVSLALLALSSGSSSRIDPGVLRRGQESALAWLRKTMVSESTQSLVMRLLVEQRFGKAEEARPLIQDLLRQQREDGGWAQIKERPSDALATGQALYALAAAKIDGTHEAVQRASAFLAQSQGKDGSWSVRTRLSGKKDAIISYYGSGWAVLGLLQYVAE